MSVHLVDRVLFLVALLAARGHGLQVDETKVTRVATKASASQDDDALSCPSIFVAVFTGRANILRRSEIRSMWNDIRRLSGGAVDWKYALCRAPSDEDPMITHRLVEEYRAFGDILEMDCEEGYLNGLLSIKVHRAMSTYLDLYDNYSFFMKIDDDAFIRSHRFCELLKWREDMGKNNSSLYAGVFAEAKETMDTRHPPIRDPDSPWYEPYEVFNGDTYPKAAKGGPGYMISHGLVRQMVDNGIPQNNILRNEDKAVGVWIDKIVQSGTAVEFLNLPGTDGYDEHRAFITTTGPWKEYPHMLHHHLSGKTIACLHNIEMLHEPHRAIDACFTEWA